MLDWLESTTQPRITPESALRRYRLEAFETGLPLILRCNREGLLFLRLATFCTPLHFARAHSMAHVPKVDAKSHFLHIWYSGAGGKGNHVLIISYFLYIWPISYKTRRSTWTLWCAAILAPPTLRRPTANALTGLRGHGHELLTVPERGASRVHPNNPARPRILQVARVKSCHDLAPRRRILQVGRVERYPTAASNSDVRQIDDGPGYLACVRVFHATSVLSVAVPVSRPQAQPQSPPTAPRGAATPTAP